MALTFATASIALAAPEFPLELPDLECRASGVRSTGLCIIIPSVNDILLSGLPRVVVAFRPLEVDLATSAEVISGSHAAETVARYISTHARLSLSLASKEGECTSFSVPISVRSSSSGWIARALFSPEYWADAASVTVVSLLFAGRSLSCDRLPMTLRVGYNHAPMRTGGVVRASRSGDIAALQAALDAGGSTEETQVQ